MKRLIGIILSGLLIGFFAASIITYPAGVGNAVTNPWEALQLTAYKIAGQEEKATGIEERIENGQSSPKELEELPNEEDSPDLTNMPEKFGTNVR